MTARTDLRVTLAIPVMAGIALWVPRWHPLRQQLQRLNKPIPANNGTAHLTGCAVRFQAFQVEVAVPCRPSDC